MRGSTVRAERVYLFLMTSSLKEVAGGQHLLAGFSVLNSLWILTFSSARPCTSTRLAARPTGSPGLLTDSIVSRWIVAPSAFTSCVLGWFWRHCLSRGGLNRWLV